MLESGGTTSKTDVPSPVFSLSTKRNEQQTDTKSCNSCLVHNTLPLPRLMPFYRPSSHVSASRHIAFQHSNDTCPLICSRHRPEFNVVVRFFTGERCIVHVARSNVTHLKKHLPIYINSQLTIRRDGRRECNLFRKSQFQSTKGSPTFGPFCTAFNGFAGNPPVDSFGIRVNFA